MAYLIGVDLGTSGTKTVLFAEDGTVAASCTIEYPLYQPQNGWVEQDPLDWWNAVCGTTKAVVAKAGISASEIKGVGLSGQMHGLVMLDKSGNILRKSIIWCDQRTAKECEEITQKVGAENLIKITANPALTGFTASKIMWVKNNEPEIYEKCAHILLPKDFIRYKLTGEFATEVSDASGMQLLDVPNRKWSDQVLDALQIDKSLLGKVYESPEITGKVTKAASDLTGLAEGTAVVGGAGDNAAAAVGTGTVQALGIGRNFTSVHIVNSKNLLLVCHRYFAYGTHVDAKFGNLGTTLLIYSLHAYGVVAGSEIGEKEFRGFGCANLFSIERHFKMKDIAIVYCLTFSILGTYGEVVNLSEESVNRGIMDCEAHRFPLIIGQRNMIFHP